MCRDCCTNLTCEERTILIGSTITGAGIGAGVGSAFAGVGAAPGALIGGGIGFCVGTIILIVKKDREQKLKNLTNS